MSWNLLVNQDMHFFPLPGHTKGAIMACPSSVVLVVQELRHQLYLVPILNVNKAREKDLRRENDNFGPSKVGGAVPGQPGLRN